MIGDVIELSVCEDCVQYIANAEFPPEPDSLWKPEHFEQRWFGYQVVMGGAHDDSGELGFCWSPCDGCGSALGGNRWKASAWKEDYEV